MPVVHLPTKSAFDALATLVQQLQSAIDAIPTGGGGTATIADDSIVRGKLEPDVRNDLSAAASALQQAASAQNTAAGAASTANTALSVANTASTAASSAATAADTATQAANNASSAADVATTAANNATAALTNIPHYLYYNSSTSQYPDRSIATNDAAMPVWWIGPVFPTGAIGGVDYWDNTEGIA